jgi:hypothetical protein
MYPKIPEPLIKVSEQIPKAFNTKRLTKEEKIALIKHRFGLTHGKGLRKKKRKKKKG